MIRAHMSKFSCVSSHGRLVATPPIATRENASWRRQAATAPRSYGILRAYAIPEGTELSQFEGNSMSEEERMAEILTGTTKRIKLLGQQGRMKDAIQALAGLAQQGVQPDTLAATATVRACIKDMALAQSVFDELFGSDDFLQPDEVSFAVLLRGYGSRNPPDWSRIDATLTTMRNKFGITPTATSYNPLLEVCCRTNDLDRGQDVIDRMASDDVEPDEFSAEVVSKRKVLRSYLKKTFNL